MQNARFHFCKLQKLAARSAKKCKMQDAKIKNCILQQQIRRLIQKSAKCKLHARFFPLISFCKLQQIFGCKKFLISKYPPLAQMPVLPLDDTYIGSLIQAANMRLVFFFKIKRKGTTFQNQHSTSPSLVHKILANEFYIYDICKTSCSFVF